jgi:shikimate dehydrogenase
VSKVAAKQFAVFGQPIAHSLSPQIHQAFATQFGIALSYERIECNAAQFETLLAQFKNQGAAGANVTLPLKQIAPSFCVQLDAAAQTAGSVNTLIRRGDDWLGANTDGIGLIRDLTIRHGLDLSGKSLLMIGAGGAARGVMGAFKAAGVAQIVIANRTLARAESLAAQFLETAVALESLAETGSFDVIVHASSAGHQASRFEMPAWPKSIAHGQSVLVDLSYGTAAAPALAFASELEIQAFDGLGMLIEQAAEAFYLWHGVRPDTAPIWGQLRAQF